MLQVEMVSLKMGTFLLQVGIPYPPLMDVRVRLKRRHNDANAALLGSGSAWYAAEAFRAVNQAVGRLLIRASGSLHELPLVWVHIARSWME